MFTLEIHLGPNKGFPQNGDSSRRMALRKCGDTPIHMEPRKSWNPNGGVARLFFRVRLFLVVLKKHQKDNHNWQGGGVPGKKRTHLPVTGTFWVGSMWRKPTQKPTSQRAPSTCVASWLGALGNGDDFQSASMGHREKNGDVPICVWVKIEPSGNRRFESFPFTRVPFWSLEGRRDPWKEWKWKLTLE